MLDSIRQHAQGWFAWAILIIVCVPFALWGINQYEGGGGSVDAATVNGKEISVADFQRAYQQQREQQRERIQSVLGKNFDPSLINDKEIKRNALENLIEREVLVQGAHDAGMRVSPVQVGARIRAIPQLQTDGKFDDELYRRLVRAQGLSVGGFEQAMGEDLLIQQLTSGIADSAFVTEQELEALLRVKLQQRDIGYAVVPASAYLGGVTVDDKAVEQYYKDNPDRFRTPEQASVDYLELSVDQLAQGVTVSEDDLRERYQERAADFTTPEERHARHILIPVASDAPPAEVEAAKKKAEDLLARIRKGEPFAELAKQYSQDPGSAKQGGDLGFFGRGAMDKAFEKAAFSLKPGEVSEPVRSTFGFHLIKLEETRGGESKPFDQVRAALERDVRHQKAEDLYFDQAETLSNLTFEHADSLKEAAGALHLPIRSSALFTRDNGSGVAADPKVREVAFSDDVLLGGKNSEAVELNPDHVVVLHLKEHKPAALRELDAVRDQIRQALRLEAAKDKTRSAGEDLVHRLQGGEDPAKALASLKLSWQRPGLIGRDDSKLDPQLAKAVFAAPRPGDDNKPQFAGEALASGDYAVYGVFAVKDGDPAAADAQTRDSLKGALLRERGQMVFKDYVDGLKSNMKIVRHEDQL
jgi:peptidyl-prolyl cis-trans isomerase D